VARLLVVPLLLGQPGVGKSLAPSFAPWIQQHLTLLRIFWMNPIMSVPTFTATIFMVHLKPPKKSHWRENISKLDLPSFAIFLASIVCLLIALQWGGTMYAWKNARVIVLLILFGVLLGVFIFMQIRKKDTGLVPLRIITRRSIFFGMMYSFCNSGAGFILQYWVSLSIKRPYLI
jgi:hypothetical protein